MNFHSGHILYIVGLIGNLITVILLRRGFFDGFMKKKYGGDADLRVPKAIFTFLGLCLFLFGLISLILEWNKVGPGGRIPF